MEDSVWTHAHPYVCWVRSENIHPPDLTSLYNTNPSTLPTIPRSSYRPDEHTLRNKQAHPHPHIRIDDPLRSGVGVAPTPRTFTAVGTEYGDGEPASARCRLLHARRIPACLPCVCLASPGVHVSRHGLPRLWSWHGEAVSLDTGHGGFFQVTASWIFNSLEV